MAPPGRELVRKADARAHADSRSLENDGDPMEQPAILDGDRHEGGEAASARAEDGQAGARTIAVSTADGPPSCR